MQEGGVDNIDSNRVNGSNKSTATKTQVDPSTMTKELLAFQESLKAAIANNELQEAVQEEYRRKQDDDVNPAVVIVTDSLNNVGVNTDNDSDKIENPIAIDLNEIYDEITGASNTATDVSSGTPNISASPNAAEAKRAEDLRTVGIVTSGIIGAAFMSVLLISLIAMGRKRRRDGGDGDETIVKVKEQIRRHHRNRHSKAKRLFESANIANSASRRRDEEEGFTGRTARTVESDSTQTSSSIDTLVRRVASSSSGYSLVSDMNTETTTAFSNKPKTNSNEKMKIAADMTTSDLVSRDGVMKIADDLTTSDVVSRDGVMKIADDLTTSDVVSGDGAMKITADFTASDVVSSDGATSFKENNLCRNDATDVEEANAKHDDEDDDNENDFVLGEDDDSHSSVVEHLLSVSRSSDYPVPSESQNTLESPLSDSKEATSSNNFFPKGPEDSGTVKVSHVPTQDSPPEKMNPFSELNEAIANEDWATVGAEAAIFASEPQPPIRRAKVEGSSSPSATLTDISQKTDELDRLVEAGDWQAVVVTAASYDAEEDANRSYQSKTSTQGSDTNDSFVSLVDNSSEGRSMDRSATTSGSQKERLQDIRAQVMELVRDVVPDEEQNVDEMMIQFKDREQELLETLISMKEKLVARNARVQSQKMARTNARNRDQSEDSESSGSTTQSPNPKDTATGDDTTIDEANTNDDNAITAEGGYFENATRVDENKAALDAASWAIQRSLDQMMEKEGNP